MSVSIALNLAPQWHYVNRQLWLQGKRISDVANRMHVAMPKSRDAAARPPVIPPSVLAARAKEAAADASTAAAASARVLAKDLQVRS